MEITKREIIASITIICFMLMIGLAIYDTIKDYIIDKNEIYNKAIHIKDQDLFEYGMATNVGKAFIYGELATSEPVTYDEIEGEYMYLKKVKEQYTQHSRQVSYKCGKSTCYRTEYYWTWDTVGREYKSTEKVIFLGVEFNFEQFNTPSASYITTIKTGSHTRYKYYGVPTKLQGTIFTELKDNNIGKSITLYENISTQELYECLTNEGIIWLFIFWFAWLCLTGGLVCMFYYSENEWLY